MRVHIAATDAMIEEAKAATAEISEIAQSLIAKANGAYARHLLARKDSVAEAPNKKAPSGVPIVETGEGK